MMSVVILCIYLAVLFLIAYSVKNRVNTAQDYLLAGRSVGFWMLSGSLAATHFGAGFVLGGASWGVQYGIGGIWYGLACGLGLFLLSLFAGKLRSLSLYTVPQLLLQRYHSPSLSILATALSLMALIGILAAQVWACSAIFEVLGLTHTGMAAALACLVFIAYTSISGLWAAIVTDFFQILLGTAGIFMATLFAFWKLGSWDHLTQKLDLLYADGVLPFAPHQFFEWTTPGVGLIGLTLLSTSMYTLIGQDFYQRLFSAKSEKVSQSSALAAGIFLGILACVPALTGLFALALSDDPQSVIAQPKTAVPLLLLEVMGPVWGAIFVAAILAAIMSTADSLLSSASTHVSKDVFEKYMRPNAPDAVTLLVARSATWAVGILALALSFVFKDIIRLLLYAYDFYTAGIFVPLIGGLLWKRPTKSAALASASVGIICVLLRLFGWLGSGIHDITFFVSALASATVFVSVTLLRPKPRDVSAATA